jgi:hypothetical protein
MPPALTATGSRATAHILMVVHPAIFEAVGVAIHITSTVLIMELIAFLITNLVTGLITLGGTVVQPVLSTITGLVFGLITNAGAIVQPVLSAITGLISGLITALYRTLFSGSAKLFALAILLTALNLALCLGLLQCRVGALFRRRCHGVACAQHQRQYNTACHG